MFWMVIRRSWLYLLLLLILLSSSFYFEYNQGKQVINAQAHTLLHKNTANLLGRLQGVLSDLNFLAHYNPQAYLSTFKQEQAAYDLDSFYLDFCRYKHLYDQVRFINIDGQELIRVNFNNGHPALVEQKDLQNKQNRYYFSQANKLQDGQVHVSRFDLNIEHGQIEEPQKPMLRISTPVFCQNGNRLGVVVLNYLGDNLLNNLQGENNTPINLINDAGYYLKGDGKNEWGFMIPRLKNNTMAKTNQRLWQQMQADSGMVQNDHGLYVFDTIDLHKAMLAQYDDADIYIPNTSFDPTKTIGTWKIFVYAPATIFDELKQTIFTRLITIALIMLFAIFILSYNRVKSDYRLDQANKKIARREAIYRTMLDNLPDGSIVMFNKDMRYMLAGGPGLKAAGLTQDIMLGRTLYDIYNEKDIKFWEDYYKKTLDGQVSNVQVTIGGRTFETYFHPVPGENSSVNGGIILSQDVTFRQKIEQDLRSTNRQLEEAITKANELATAAEVANYAKSEFLANMSHEIRTPLNAILGFSEILSTRIDDPELNSYVRSIRSSGKSLLTIINDILDLSKIEAGKMQIKTEPVKLQAVIEEIGDIFSMQITKKGLELYIDYDPLTPDVLMLDEIRLRQVMFNLLGNAVKFTHKGKVTIVVKQTELTGKDTPQIDLEIGVKDTGIGIPEDQQQSIFNAFVQQDGQSTKRYGGTGLGLAISKRLAELMGGDIEIVSTYGVGSEFWLKFASVAVASPKINQTEHQYKVVDYGFKESTIVVADDIKANRMIIKELLKESSINILEAQNGLEVLDLIARKPVDAILMDMRMPVMDGLQATQKLRQQSIGKSIPVIALTASILDFEPHQERLFTQILRKPVTSSQILHTLADVLPCAPVSPAITADPEDLQELDLGSCQRLHKFLPQLEDLLEESDKLRHNRSIQAAQDFVDKLNSVTTELNITLVNNYLTDLRAFLDSFDVVGLDKSLASFPQFVAKLKEKCKEQTDADRV